MAIIRFNSPNEEELSPDELSALLTSVMPDVAGYRVIRMIGRGGMSYVYLGVQESLDRQVAIKITAPHILKDEISKQRFEQEARTIAKLEHPCIVSIHEVGRTPQGLIYYVMPYLSKGHLGQRDFRDNEARVVEVLRALLAALDYAHARGIVHRDVKAENVLFDNADRPLLTDFGIALSKRNAARITTEGLAVGSAGYMAPEQARGEQVDGRADLYSVGVLAFELLTGSLPYQATEALALALMHAQDPVPLLPPERRHWQPFIATAMAKSREARFKNAQQMLSALNEVSMRIGAPTSGNFEHIPSQSSNRKNWLIPSIAAAAVIAVGALATIQPVWLSQIGQMFFGGPVESTPIVLSSDEISEAMAEPLVDAIEPVTSSPVLTAVDAGAFVAITAGFNSSPLPYDPTIRGERELASIDRQITQSRLTTPRGDNAFDSLMAYRRFAPNDVRVGRYADRVLLSFTDQIARLQKGKQDEAAKALHIKSVELVSTFKLENSKSWTDYSQRSLATVQSMLQQAGRSRNQSGIAAAISFAKAYGVPEPTFSSALDQARIGLLPKAGEQLPGIRPRMRIVVAPTEGKAGLAVMEEEVSRGEYDSFVRATGRESSKCKSGLFQTRSWNDPGFPQTSDHPVVCVTLADARAFALWQSKSSGVSMRLPTAADWKHYSSAPAKYEPCKAGLIDCNREKGTQAAGGFPTARFSLRDVHGNAAEWLDLASGNNVAGPSWRDQPARVSAGQSRAESPERGYDDVGFRLVADVRVDDLLR